MLAKPDPLADLAADVDFTPAPRSPWRVVSAQPLPDYRLKLTFRDGTVGTVDMKSAIFAANAGVFASLRDVAVFNSVRVATGAPTWPGEIDVAPDALYDGVRASEDGLYRL